MVLVAASCAILLNWSIFSVKTGCGAPHKNPIWRPYFFRAENSSSRPLGSMGHHISMPSYPSSFTLEQRRSTVPWKPHPVASILRSKPAFQEGTGRSGTARLFREESINAVVADAVVLMKCLLFLAIVLLKG